MQRPPTAKLQEQRCAKESRDEPKQHIDEIDPDGVFHSFEGAVVVWLLLVDEEFAEDAEEGGPEDAVGGKEEEEEVSGVGTGGGGGFGVFGNT